MTSMEAAMAASSLQRTPIKGTETLWSEGTIAFEVPILARSGDYSDESKRIHFIHFPQGVKGGVVNFFVHGDDAEKHRGEMIVARCHIIRKTFIDGRSFLHVDLQPTEDLLPSHALLVVTRTFDLPQTMPADAKVFETPDPLQGALIVSTDHEFTIARKKEERRPALTEPRGSYRDFSRLEPKGTGTGDVQLDRLLAAGWEIVSQNKQVANLKKGERTMTHHKPKQKNAKRR